MMSSGTRKDWAPALLPRDVRAAERLREWLDGEAGGLDVVGFDLSGSNLSGGNFSESWFTDAQLVDVKMVGVELYRSDAQGADFTGADLSGASLVRVNFDDAVFCRAILDRADLVKASLCDVDATGASCRGTHFMGASLLDVDFSGADLTGATVKENSFKVRMNEHTIVQGLSGTVFGPVEILEGGVIKTVGGSALEGWIRERGGDVRVISAATKP